jgi:hypothetical protein
MTAHSFVRHLQLADMSIKPNLPYPVLDMPERNPGNVIRWLFSSRDGALNRLVPRWIFLRALAAIYFSAFYTLLFQIEGLIGPSGILPAQSYLTAVARTFPSKKFWFAPTLFWFSSSEHALMMVTWVGVVASILAFLNLWPRFSFFVCSVSCRS